jgi:hypothetical protein
MKTIGLRTLGKAFLTGCLLAQTSVVSNRAFAQQTTTVFTNEAAWQAANPRFRFEGFDDQPGGSLGTRTFTFSSGIRATASADDLYIGEVGFGFSIGGSEPNVLTDLSQGGGWPSEFVFDLPTPASAAGLLIIDHEHGDSPEWLDFYSHDRLILRIQPLPFDNRGGGRPTDGTPAFFLGISTAENAITRMIVHFERTAFFIDSVAVDNVQFAFHDSDADGVPDELDMCPDTTMSATVDLHGCSIEQLVPCDGPRTGGAWKNHGQYISTIKDTAETFLAAGLITTAEKNAILKAAARSDCGKPRAR